METFSSPDEAPMTGLVSVDVVEAPPLGLGREEDASYSEGSVLQTGQLRAADAFEVFAGKTYETRVGSEVSVSTVAGGAAGTARVRGGEDPLARYFRLKAEIDELETDVEALVPSSGSHVPTGQPNVRPNEIWKQMRLELQAMRARLARVGDSAVIKPLRAEAVHDGTPPPEASTSVTSDALLKVVASLQRYPTELEAMTKSSENIAAESPVSATYELYCAPRGSDGDEGADEASARVAKIQMLEGRVKNLERAIGSYRGVLAWSPRPSHDGAVVINGASSASAARNSTGPAGIAAGKLNIRQSLEHLEARMDHLDPAAVAEARKELRPLQAQLTKILAEQKKREAPGDGAASVPDSAAVQELFRRTQVCVNALHFSVYSSASMLNRAILVILQVIDDAGPALPELLSRLRSLHALHEQSVLWVNRLTAVEVNKQALQTR